MLMLMTGVSGGDEMRDLHWGMFSKRVNAAGDVLFWVWDPNTFSEKNHDGGIRDFRHQRACSHIEYFRDGRPKHLNPGLLFEKYHDSMPPEWTNAEFKNPLFPKPLSKKKYDGVSVARKHCAAAIG